jgi:hypothetical protein
MKYQDYSLWKISGKNIRQIAEFVVKTNYKRHQNDVYPQDIEEKINEVYEYEKEFKDNSIFYILKDGENNIIGSIRVMKWNGISVLPIQREFHIEIENLGLPLNNIWHIGRFAVNSGVESFEIINLFKILLICAFRHICENKENVLLAECDKKLLITIKRLGVKIKELGTSSFCLGSETFPIITDAEGLAPFMENNYMYLWNYSTKIKKSKFDSVLLEAI